MVNRNRLPISVVLSAFEDIVARGLRSLIDEDPNLVLVAAGVPTSRIGAVLAESRPHVAVINYGSLSSVVEVRELSRQHPETRFVVLANHPTPAECRQMLAFGATACLAKSTQARDVLNAIHLASRGLHVLPPASASGGPDGPDLLTPREAEVLELLQSGRSNAEIAAALNVGIETVRTHARRVFRKLGVKTRRELQARR
jgi:DNA-binding NarL/FixJ family response regulator